MTFSESALQLCFASRYRVSAAYKDAQITRQTGPRTHWRRLPRRARRPRHEKRREIPCANDSSFCSPSRLGWPRIVRAGQSNGAQAAFGGDAPKPGTMQEWPRWNSAGQPRASPKHAGAADNYNISCGQSIKAYPIYAPDREADGDDAAVSRSQRRTQPEITEQQVGRVVDDAWRNMTNVLLNPRRAFGFRCLIERQKGRRDRRKLICPDTALFEYILDDGHGEKCI